MFTLLKRYRELIVVAALLVYPFLRFLAVGHKERAPNVVDRAVLALSAPIQRVLTWTIDGVVSSLEAYVALLGVREQNVGLVDENARLRAEVASLTEARAENERLRGLLGYAQQTPAQEIPARVLGVNPVPSLLSVRIDRGEDDGVRRGMPVVTRDGVVGQVERSTGGTADVVLLGDANSRVGVRNQRSRARASAAGTGGGRNLRLENALRTEDLEEGDVIITSGTDGVYPPGLVVGRLTAVQRKNFGMFQTAEIIPAVDATKLEEILVVPWTSGPGPAPVPPPPTVQALGGTKP